MPWLVALVMCALAIGLAFRSARNAVSPAEKGPAVASQANDAPSELSDDEAQARRASSKS
ncbi:hypothetical protein CMZ84_02905 [Lysobacteraceae bacterium NML93-0399]|nr:hypothetical protein CMZ84_02905 [Xanthomonadaceae bacterium NML93-0399]